MRYTKGVAMLTASYTGARTIEVGETIAQPPGPGEAQIKVGFVGLCGTDLHLFHGDMDARVERPAVFGHEMSGTVVALGEGVDPALLDKAVTVMPLDWDGTCAACQEGNSHICQNLDFIGIDTPGALQGLWNVPASTLVECPPDVRLDHAALVEPSAVAVHDVRRGRVGAGDSVVVIGGGPIGLLIATVAREFGGDVVVSELDEGRRSTAAKLDFATIDPGKQDSAAVVEEWTSGKGADVVFEVSGAAQAVLGATSLAKVRGRLVVVAIHHQPREVDLKQVFWRELELFGARVYQRPDFETAVELLQAGVLPVEDLITRIVPLPETAAALERLEAGRGMKILVDVGGSQ